jgi:hypothetical protein
MAAAQRFAKPKMGSEESWTARVISRYDGMWTVISG